MEPITAGVLLSRTFMVFFRHFGIFMTITLLVNLPVFLIMRVTGQVMVFLGFIAGAMASCTIGYGVMQDFRGRRVEFGECLSVGFSTIPRVFVVSLLTGLATFAGFMALIIPGVMVSVMLSTAPVVAVMERLGGVDALARSARLTEGHRWQIFLLYVALSLLVVGPAVLFSAQAGDPDSVGDGSFSAGQILGEVAGTLGSALFATAPAVVYHALRTQKEGVDTATIASVFD